MTGITGGGGGDRGLLAIFTSTIDIHVYMYKV